MAGDVLASVVGQSVRVAPAAKASEVRQTADDPRQTVAETGSILPPEDAKKPAEAKEIESAVMELNNFVQSLRRELQFSVDEESGQTVITVVDAETDEMIRQIPPEEVLNAARNLRDHAGLLLKAEA